MQTEAEVLKKEEETSLGQNSYYVKVKVHDEHTSKDRNARKKDKKEDMVEQVSAVHTVQCHSIKVNWQTALPLGT